MTISVIIPTLNEERALPDTLAQANARGIHEILVVDGGSRDGTRDVVSEYAKKMATSTNHLSRIVCFSAPSGRARQMNAGAAAARGDILLFLHADSRLPPGAADAVQQVLENPRYAGGRFDVRFEPSTKWGRLIATMMNLRSRWTGIATGDQALFVRREIFEQLGGFADIPLMEDIEFSRRLKRAGRIAALRLTVTASYRRWETNGALRTILLMWGLRILYWLGINPRALKQLYSDVR